MRYSGLRSRGYFQPQLVLQHWQGYFDLFGNIVGAIAHDLLSFGSVGTWLWEMFYLSTNSCQKNAGVVKFEVFLFASSRNVGRPRLSLS